MDYRVDFLHHASSSTDSLEKSGFAVSVFDENRKLHQENQKLLEQFHQKIYEIQHEKETVRLRLIAVESDYEVQMKELQMEIMNLREEIQQQKRHCVNTNLEYEDNLQILAEEKAVLKKELDGANCVVNESRAHMKEIQLQLQTARASIQSHVHQIESLRAEIAHLKEDKLTLEQKLQVITEERDTLLTALSDAQHANALLQQENANHKLLISHQENELEQLQKTATLLKNQLETLNSAAPPSRKAETAYAENPNSQRSDPHQSLMGELLGLNRESGEDHWWYKHVELNPSMAEFYEDDGIEIDDASLLTALTSSGRLIRNEEPNTTIRMEADMNLDSSSQTEFMENLRTEVAEIYQQLRQMCLDVSAQSVNGNFSGPGDCTPDQLARIEWDFRLASLRNVLTDLRGLLQDLVSIPSPMS